MQMWMFILCPALVLALTETQPKHEKQLLDENTWQLMLQDEWMIGFCVPLIMSCIKFDRAWTKFAQEQPQLHVATIKLEYSETIIRRFSLHDLPTILHVKDGVFRKLPVAQSVAELRQLALGKWQDTEPMPFWQHPNGLLIHAYIRYIRAIDMVWTRLDIEYELATWLVRIGLALILAGSVLAICGIYKIVRDRRQSAGKPVKQQHELAPDEPKEILDECEPVCKIEAIQ